MWIAVPIVGNRSTFCRASKKDPIPKKQIFNPLGYTATLDLIVPNPIHSD